MVGRARLGKLTVAGICVAIAAPLGAAREARPQEAMAGIVMAIEGRTSPELRQFQEIGSGLPLQIADGGKLTFLHYEACRLVTLAGPGIVTLEKGSWATDEAKTEGEERHRCPKHYELGNEKSGAAPSFGGTVLRSGQPPIRVGPRPLIILTGAGVADLVAADILESTGKLVSSHRPPKGYLTLAQNDPSLMVDSQYFLVLQSTQSAERHEIRLAVAAAHLVNELAILRVP